MKRRGRTKIKQILLFFTLGAPLILIGQAAGSPANHWQKIDEGFEARSMQLDGPTYQTFIKLRVLKVDMEKFLVRVIDSRVFGTDRMEIRILAQKTQALAAVNGSFFMPDYRPLGLLIIDGREVNPLRKTDWGVFLVQDNRPRIIHTKEFHNERPVSQALQVGPRVVVAGRELLLKKQVARRSALGITFKNQIILLNSEDTNVYLQDLARIFRLPESEGGLECRDALTLDGGPSAQMYVDYKSLKINLPGGWPVPNGIGVFKRTP
ncbi:MAG: phosphodiester glycosidase family protein [Deltaproteobacteria bacterium]|nr:phosphodiester glycosidase family protein [Deltaproteobacteria bacterium]